MGWSSQHWFITASTLRRCALWMKSSKIFRGTVTKKACSCAPCRRHGLMTHHDHFICQFIPFLIRKMILQICSNMRPMYKSQQSESHSIIPWFAEANPHVLRSSFGTFLSHEGIPEALFWFWIPPWLKKHLWYPLGDKPLPNHNGCIPKYNRDYTRVMLGWSIMASKHPPLPIFPFPAFQKGSGLKSQSVGHLTDGGWYYFGAFQPTC